MRWDNAPHHPELDTFPCHLHIKEQINSSKKITLIEALKIIENNL
jgi:hypothetical protein